MPGRFLGVTTSAVKKAANSEEYWLLYANTVKLLKNSERPLVSPLGDEKLSDLFPGQYVSCLNCRMESRSPLIKSF